MYYFDYIHPEGFPVRIYIENVYTVCVCVYIYIYMYMIIVNAGECVDMCVRVIACIT